MMRMVGGAPITASMAPAAPVDLIVSDFCVVPKGVHNTTFVDSAYCPLLLRRQLWGYIGLRGRRRRCMQCYA